MGVACVCVGEGGNYIDHGWTKMCKLSTHCRFLRRYVDLHTSIQGFHELENLKFLQKRNG